MDHDDDFDYGDHAAQIDAPPTRRPEEVVTISAGSLAVIVAPSERWVVTTDRSGRRAYASPGGSAVCKDGTGITPVTVYYPGFVDWFGTGRMDYGMTNTVREGKAWADAAEGVAP